MPDPAFCDSHASLHLAFLTDFWWHYSAILHLAEERCDAKHTENVLCTWSESVQLCPFPKAAEIGGLLKGQTGTLHTTYSKFTLYKEEPKIPREVQGGLANRTLQLHSRLCIQCRLCLEATCVPAWRKIIAHVCIAITQTPARALEAFGVASGTGRGVCQAGSGAWYSQVLAQSRVEGAGKNPAEHATRPVGHEQPPLCPNFCSAMAHPNFYQPPLHDRSTVS